MGSVDDSTLLLPIRMTELTSKQRARLRSLAHPLKSILQVGVDGVSEPFLASLNQAFNTRELLKVRVLETNELSVKEAAHQMVDGLPGVEVVQTIGNVAVLYRPFPENPEIK